MKKIFGYLILIPMLLLVLGGFVFAIIESYGTIFLTLPLTFGIIWLIGKGVDLIENK